LAADNSIQRTILSTFMKNKHIAYGIAENGQEAVDRWSTGNYHLVLVCAFPKFVVSTDMSPDGYPDAGYGRYRGYKTHPGIGRRATPGIIGPYATLRRRPDTHINHLQ
jgi:hypothetical protein